MKLAAILPAPLPLVPVALAPVALAPVVLAPASFAIPKIPPAILGGVPLLLELEAADLYAERLLPPELTDISA